METKVTATEDEADEEYLNKLGMGWGAIVLTESGINDDTLRDSTQPDHTRDLTTDPDKDPTTPIKDEEVEAAKTTEKEIDEPTDELANESLTDYENAPDNQTDGKATNTPYGGTS